MCGGSSGSWMMNGGRWEVCFGGWFVCVVFWCVLRLENGMERIRGNQEMEIGEGCREKTGIVIFSKQYCAAGITSLGV